MYDDFSDGDDDDGTTQLATADSIRHSIRSALGPGAGGGIWAHGQGVGSPRAQYDDDSA